MSDHTSNVPDLYTDADVQAAWEAAYGASYDPLKIFPIEFRDMQDAIAAVAPLIAAKAFAAGFSAALIGSHLPATDDEAAERAQEWIEGA